MRWIHLDVKVTIAFSDWQEATIIKDLESSYQKNEDVQGIVFKPSKLDKWACSYDTNRFMIFYKDIIAKL